MPISLPKPSGIPLKSVLTGAGFLGGTRATLGEASALLITRWPWEAADTCAIMQMGASFPSLVKLTRNLSHSRKCNLASLAARVVSSHPTVGPLTWRIETLAPMGPSSPRTKHAGLPLQGKHPRTQTRKAWWIWLGQRRKAGASRIIASWFF